MMFGATNGAFTISRRVLRELGFSDINVLPDPLLRPLLSQALGQARGRAHLDGRASWLRSVSVEIT